jgi:hypothetical protein
VPYAVSVTSEEDVRTIALSLPETAEKPNHGLPGFRVRDKLFARIHELPDTLFLKWASIDERDELVAAEPGKFFITPHYSGYPGVLVRLDAVSRAELAEVLTEAWRVSAPKRLARAFDEAH